MSCWRIATAALWPALVCAHHLQGGAGKRDVVVVAGLSLEHIAGADEARDEFGFRPVVNILRAAELVDHAGVHHRDQVGSGHRLRLVVGDIDGGVAVFVMQPADFKTHLLAQIGVEVRQGFVEQQGFRLDDQGAGQRHALLLSAGQFAGITLRQNFEFGGFKDDVEFFGDGGAIDLSQPQAIDDIFGDRHMRPQRVALEDHRHLALFGR